MQGGDKISTVIKYQITKILKIALQYIQNDADKGKLKQANVMIDECTEQR